MANSVRPSQPMPMFVIDTCPTDDNQQPIKPPKQPTITMSRTWSLPNCNNETYKDLYGAMHYSFLNRLNTLLKRSRSYPNTHPLTCLKFNNKYSYNQSPSTSIHLNLNHLNPNYGTQTPSGSSSRYSLYGSCFDLSESGYYPPSDQKLLTVDGRPLLVLDNSARLETNTYQDKCTHWLSHLHTNTS